MNTSRSATSHRYDVFISHNRQQKEWVRQLTRMLRDGGLNVFFDEDSIDPGRNIVRAMADGVNDSRYVLLVLSPSSLRSEWVAMETAIALIDDPAASSSRLIPVLLEVLEPEKIPREVRIRSTVDLTELSSRDANLRRLLAFLGLSPEPDAVLPPWPVSSLCAVDMQEVRRWGWSGEDLVRSLVELDRELYGGVARPADELVARWTPMFVAHPETWRVLIDAPGSIIGYWHFISLFDEDFALARSGGLRYGELTADRLRTLQLPGKYDVYFSGIGIQSRYRSSHAFKLLFESLLESVATLGESGILFNSIWANGYTPEGVSLCRSLDMQQITAHRDRGEIFYGSFPALLHRPIFKLQEKLLPLYGAAYGDALPPAPGSIGD